MAYADADDLKARHDVRTIQHLATDDGEEPPEVTLGSNTIVSVALDGASGDVDMALLAGNRYTTTQLSGLTGNSLAALKDITCDLAMARLYKRRTGLSFETYRDIRDLADAHLDRLRKGQNVFNLEELKKAGLPTIDGPSVAQYERLNTIPDRAHGIYPQRGQRLPAGRGQ